MDPEEQFEDVDDLQTGGCPGRSAPPLYLSIEVASLSGVKKDEPIKLVADERGWQGCEPNILEPVKCERKKWLICVTSDNWQPWVVQVIFVFSRASDVYFDRSISSFCFSFLYCLPAIWPVNLPFFTY